MIRAIIVDDESPARREMRRLLAGHEDVEILGDFATPAESLATPAESLAALAAKPDIVFLDIQMPGESGLEAATRLASSGASIVFVTAYHQHALQAFELAAFDYLLKPSKRSVSRRRWTAFVPDCLAMLRMMTRHGRKATASSSAMPSGAGSSRSRRSACWSRMAATRAFTLARSVR